MQPFSADQFGRRRLLGVPAEPGNLLKVRMVSKSEPGWVVSRFTDPSAQTPPPAPPSAFAVYADGKLPTGVGPFLKSRLTVPIPPATPAALINAARPGRIYRS